MSNSKNHGDKTQSDLDGVPGPFTPDSGYCWPQCSLRLSQRPKDWLQDSGSIDESPVIETTDDGDFQPKNVQETSNRNSEKGGYSLSKAHGDSFDG